MKRHETIHAVTFEIAETRVGTAAAFQPRIRLDAIVFADLGLPRRSPLDALEVLAQAFESAGHGHARDPGRGSGGGPMPALAVPALAVPALVRRGGDRSGEAA